MIYSFRMQILRHVRPFLFRDVGETRMLPTGFFFRRLATARGSLFFLFFFSFFPRLRASPSRLVRFVPILLAGLLYLSRSDHSLLNLDVYDGDTLRGMLKLV